MERGKCTHIEPGKQAESITDFSFSFFLCQRRVCPPTLL
jgi:hypothetical protein